MTPAALHAALSSRLPGGVRGLHEATDPWLELAADAVPEVLRLCRDEHGLRHLNDLSAADIAPRPGKERKFTGEPRLEVVYRLSDLPLTTRATFKVLLPRVAAPEVPTVSHLFPAADWHEREAFDLFGIVFTGHPNLQRLLLPDEWTGHPLRKDYAMPEEYGGVRCR